jgi:DNA primase
MMRLTPAQIQGIRDAHPLVEVLARAGVMSPSGTRSMIDFMIRCPTRHHEDSTPSTIVHPRTDRWYCFGCGSGGDVLQLVMDMHGITSLTNAVEMLERGRLLISKESATAPARGRPRAIDTEQHPDVSRTSFDRVIAVNSEAWRYLTLPRLADRAREYLLTRGIVVDAIDVNGK